MLNGPGKPPRRVGWIQIVGRDGDPETSALRGLEESLDVRDGVVLLDALADQPPGDAMLAQDIVLRVDDDDSCIILLDFQIHAHSPVAGFPRLAKSGGVPDRPTPATSASPAFRSVMGRSPRMRDGTSMSSLGWDRSFRSGLRLGRLTISVCEEGRGQHPGAEP